jgi:ribosomal protein L29
MTFENIRGKPEGELRARLTELTQENFKARFTTEPMKSERGAEVRKRRREIARLKTILTGRQTLAGARAEKAELESAIASLGKPHEGDAMVKARRSKLMQRLKHVNRTIRELSPLSVS